MSDVSIGIMLVIVGLFVFFISPQDGSTIGYNIPRLSRKEWSLSNRFIGRLFLIGAIIYLISAVVLNLTNMNSYNTSKWLKVIFLVYFLISIISTEIYTYRKIKSEKNRRS